MINKKVDILVVNNDLFDYKEEKLIINYII